MISSARAWLEPRHSKRYLLSRANTGATLETWSKIVDRLSVQIHIDHDRIEVEKWLVDDAYYFMNQFMIGTSNVQ